jgi:ribokinase
MKSKTFDVITFGSATWDVFVRDKEIFFEKNSKIFNKKAVHLPLGSKIEIDQIHFSSGGGGTNVAATFASLGFETACCSIIGLDPAGNQLIDDLKSFNVDTSLIARTNKKPTNHSIILSVPGQDRTILTYRGASELFSSEKIPWDKIKSKWLYIAPLSGKSRKIFKSIVDFGFKNKIKIAVNPGNSQIKMPDIRKIIEKTDVLFLNQEEASLLTKIPYNKEKEIFEKISGFYPGIFVMTKGRRGAIASQGENRYQVKVLKSKIKDRTGAGDSFASGFVSGIIEKNDIEYALQLASANATNCLEQWGAKNGLLKKNQKFRKIQVKKYVG